MRRPRKYDNDIRSQFRKFVYRVACRLVDRVEKQENPYNNTPRINKIVDAVYSLMYIFRLRYRNLYKSVKHRIRLRENFIEFCKDFYHHEKLPYFFTFLLNLAMKFEMFLYLREEGHNYFAVFAHMIADDTNYFYFEAKGGADRLADTAYFFLRRAEDLQVLVNSEDPVSEELLSLDEQLSEIDTENLDSCDCNSLLLLQNINENLYSGLQEYKDEMVLPLVILRFILDGRVPESTAAKTKKKIPVEKYFNRCLPPEIISGEAFRLRPKPESNIYEGSWSRISSVRKKEKMNRIKKMLDSEKLPLESQLSSEDKTYGDGLEWLKRFDAKTLSLLKKDSKIFDEISNSAEYCSNPFRTATGTVNICRERKESVSNYTRTEDQCNLPKNSSYYKCHGSKFQKHKEPDKLLNVQESDHRGSSKCSNTDLPDSVYNLRDNLIALFRKSKKLHCWEKKMIICLAHQSKHFSDEELENIRQRITGIPTKEHVHPVKEEDLQQFVALIKIEIACDSLYSENGQFLGKLPCPEHEGNLTDCFTDLLVNMLALCSDNIIQPKVLGKWIPIFQNRLQKNESVVLMLHNYGQNKLLPLLSTQTEELDLPKNGLYSKCYGSSVHKHKEPDKLMKVQESDDRDSLKSSDDRDSVMKLRDNLMAAIRKAKKLHFWEKKMIICLIHESKHFSDDEIDFLCQKIRSIPTKEHVHPVMGEDSKQFAELMKMEVKCDSLYSKNGEFLGKLPCPEHKGNVIDYFVELLISILALCRDDIIQPKVLGKWIPIFHNLLQKKDSLMLMLLTYGQNELLPLLRSHASK